jgi:hypothetical protein
MRSLIFPINRPPWALRWGQMEWLWFLCAVTCVTFVLFLILLLSFYAFPTLAPTVIASLTKHPRNATQKETYSHHPDRGWLPEASYLRSIPSRRSLGPQHHHLNPPHSSNNPPTHFNWISRHQCQHKGARRPTGATATPDRILHHRHCSRKPLPKQHISRTWIIKLNPPSPPNTSYTSNVGCRWGQPQND